MNTKEQQKCELEKRIYEYKLKEIKAWRNLHFIIEVNGRPVCINNKNNLVLSDAPFPTEFTSVQMHQVKNVIAGVEPKIIPVREWYKSKLKLLTQVLLITK
ncbi:MAG: hypothetical protein IT215_00050 [Chitinophagaceae bacterium]|nr:hypothetical protein [Chitinophagaceae bacterium]